MRELSRAEGRVGGAFPAPAMAEASKWVLAVAIAGAALAVGTVHSVTLCVVTGLVAVATVLGWWGAEPMRLRSPAMVLLYTGIALTAYTALQCVPMPLRWLAAIAPHNADVWSRALAPLHEPGPSWAPISLDPTATRIEVLKGVAYLLAFMTALRVARSRDGVRFLSNILIVTGLTLAAAALLHPAFGAKKLFGVYEPGPGIWERHVAPLMNPNNLAGYLNVAACLALASALGSEARRLRPLLATAVVMLAATQVWVASRSGVITLVLGVVVVLATTRAARSRDRRGLAMLSFAAGTAATIGIVLMIFAGSDASIELLDRDSSKLGLLRQVARMLPSVWTFGCGRGAFESSFPAFRTDTGYITFGYPENVVVQWLVEWGVVAGVAGLVAIATALRPGAVIVRSRVAAGAWAACGTLLVQNFADLGTEVPGLVLAGVVCAAIVVGGSPGDRTQSRVWLTVATFAPVLVLLLAGCAIVAAAVAIPGELHRDQRRLLDAATVQRVSPDQMHSAARAAMLRHPGEPYLPFVTALRATMVRDDNPVPWIAATLERASVYGTAHLLLARVLAAKVPSQARLEYRLAVSQAPDLLITVGPELPAVIKSYGDATEVVPDGAAGALVLERVVAQISARLPATAVRLDEQLLARDHNAPGPIEREALGAVLDLEAADGTPWCEGPRRAACVQTAFEASRALQTLQPERCAGFELESRARVASGDLGGVPQLLIVADRVDDRLPCLQSVYRLAMSVRDDAQADEALSRIMRAGCRTDAECAANFAWIAMQEEARGNLGRARTLYERAYGRAPDHDSFILDAARLAARQGLHGEAAADYEKLARSHPSDARWPQAAQQERDLATGTLLPPE